MHRVLLAITVIITLGVCGCGQTGPLVLPEESSDSTTSTAE